MAVEAAVVTGVELEAWRGVVELGGRGGGAATSLYAEKAVHNLLQVARMSRSTMLAN